jgi:hypothetical protein
VVEDREARAEDEPALRRRTCGHLAAVNLDAFANADKTVPEAVALRDPPAVVPYLSTRTATAGTAIHSVVGGAPGESRPTTSSSMPAIAKNAISSSNQYPRATSRIQITCRT